MTGQPLGVLVLVVDLDQVVPLLPRASLGVTFVWFGGLKLAGEPTLPRR